MKKLFTVIAIFLMFISTQAQQTNLHPDETGIDSSILKIEVTLTTEQHLFIIDFLQDVKTPRIADYIKQVVSKIDTTYNPGKEISVTVESGLVPDIYQLLSLQREGVTAAPNAIMKQRLLPQIIAFSWIIRQVQAIDAASDGIRQQHIQRAFKYVKSSKY